MRTWVRERDVSDGLAGPGWLELRVGMGTVGNDEAELVRDRRSVDTAGWHLDLLLLIASGAMVEERGSQSMSEPVPAEPKARVSRRTRAGFSSPPAGRGRGAAARLRSPTGRKRPSGKRGDRVGGAPGTIWGLTIGNFLGTVASSATCCSEGSGASTVPGRGLSGHWFGHRLETGE